MWFLSFSFLTNVLLVAVLKRNVFIFSWKVSSDKSGDHRSAGKLFHTRGPCVRHSSAYYITDVDIIVMLMVVARQRESGDSPYAVKLSVEELEGFYKQIATLPCCITEQSIVSVSWHTSTSCSLYVLRPQEDPALGNNTPTPYGNVVCRCSFMY